MGDSTRSAAIAVLELDAAGLREAAASARALVECGTSLGIDVHARSSAAWLAIVEGRPASDDELHDLEQRARTLADGALVIEAATMRALAASEQQDLEHALAHARRACRMARSEGLRQSEYLAGLVLARLRRQIGHTWLATHIVHALRRFESTPWRRFLDWEETMAAGRSSAPKQGPAARLQQLLAYADSGDHPQFEAAIDRLQAEVASLGFLRRDLACVRAALDPRHDPDAAEVAVARWCTGELAVDPPPFGLAGLNGGDAAEGICTIAMARPAARGRRLLHAAMGLALHCTAGRRLDGGRVGRREGIVSALALAGPEGLTDEALFRSAYGFAYAPSIHRGTFDVALHRARELADPFATIERTRGTTRLVVRESFVVVDPRSTGPIEDRLLAALARAGQVPARELATSLGVPLRTVQHALRGYVEAGLCRQRRDGRHVVYVIEDTTFQEPTLA